MMTVAANYVAAKKAADDAFWILGDLALKAGENNRQELAGTGEHLSVRGPTGNVTSYVGDVFTRGTLYSHIGGAQRNVFG